MEDFKLLFHLLIILYLLPPSLSSSPFDCPISFCGSNAYSVRFPFRVVGQQPGICGYLGFNLGCDKQGKLLLNIQNSGDFSVRAIDYRLQIIQLYDPSGCSAARRLTLDLSGSPFWGSPTRNYTLLTCPIEVDMTGHTLVGCISNSTHSTLATSERFALALANQTACRITGSIQSPIAPYQDQGGITSNLNMDIALSWDDPNCKECATIGGICGYTNTTKQEVACFDNTKKSNKHQLIAVIIVSIALGLPAIGASIALVCYICKDRRTVATWDARNGILGSSMVPSETATGMLNGLDRLTIESYTKVILGESKRLPGHEEAACSICLTDYNVEDIVRCIPECRHCFHADCIDEWLRVRGTCPVCRNSPTPASC
ncbi:putative RING-H2 finger protein ATL21A [Bidens hawaiensis]|uniref:putative RING-H2 finger protein ATL21A n=1 Tax=Bidens hawaiensis TaxID=980011 RepID=UPI0040492B46